MNVPVELKGEKMTDYKDGSLDQDEIDAIISGTDATIPAEDHGGKKETPGPDDVIITEKMSIMLNDTATAIKGFFGDYDINCGVASVKHCAGKPFDKCNGRTVFALIKSGSMQAAFLIDYSASWKITRVMMGHDNPGADGEMTDAEKSVMDVFFTGFCDFTVQLLTGVTDTDAVHDPIDFLKFYDRDVESFLSSGEWLNTVTVSFKVSDTKTGMALVDAPVYILLNEGMTELVMKTEVPDTEDPLLSHPGTGSVYVKKTTRESFHDKLNIYVKEKGDKSLGRRNLINFYNNSLEPDEKRYIAGHHYGEASTWSGMRRIIARLKNAARNIDKPQYDMTGDRFYGFEASAVPLTLRVQDREMTAEEIRKSEAFPSPERFSGSTASLLMGNTEVASVRIEKTVKGLSLNVIETAMDRKAGDFTLRDVYLNLPLYFSVEIGRKNIPLEKACGIGSGKIFIFDKPAGEPVDIILDDYDALFAKGEVVVNDENFGIRITDMADLNLREVISGEVTRSKPASSEPAVPVKCILGRSEMPLEKVLGLGYGSVIELDRKLMEPAELLAGDINSFNAEIMVIDGFLGARVTGNVKGVIGQQPQVSHGVSGTGEKADAKQKVKAGEQAVKGTVMNSAQKQKKAGDLIRKNLKFAVSVLEKMYSENPAEAAALLIALGAERSSAMLQQMEQETAKVLIEAVAAIERVTEENAARVLGVFIHTWEELASSFEGGEKFARNLLDKYCGKSRFPEIVGTLNLSGQRKPFAFMNKINPQHILNFIQGEHPQVIAMVLSCLEPGLAAIIVSWMPHNLQADIAERMAAMRPVPLNVVNVVESVIERKISMITGEDYIHPGGIDTVVTMINNTDRLTEKNIIEGMEKESPELAEEIKNRLFLFEDMVLLDDRSVQKVLREVDSRELAKALKGTIREVQEKFFRNMSKRAAMLLREDMEFMRPVNINEVEESQRRIVNIVRELEDAGEIVVTSINEDEFVV